MKNIEAVFRFLGILMFFGVIPVAVHRLVILGPQSIPKWKFQFGWREIDFFLYQLYLIAMLIFPLGIIIIMVIGYQYSVSIQITVPLLWVVFSLYSLSRFSFVFPSIAVDEKFIFIDSWYATKNHQSIIFFTMFTIVFVIASFIYGGFALYGDFYFTYATSFLMILINLWASTTLAFAYLTVIGKNKTSKGKF